MKESMIYKKDYPTKLQAPVFKNGQIVTADDMQTAFRYPVELMLTMVRAYFSCGVVCGLQPCGKEKDPWTVTIEPGVAVDCEGYPLEVCSPIEINLDSTACKPQNSECVGIAIQRVVDSDNEEKEDRCGRLNEKIRVGVFTSFKCINLCYPRIPKKFERCECLITCESCECKGESWIPLAEVYLLDKRVDVRYDLRRFVKPIRCHCPPKVRLEEKLCKLLSSR